MLVKVMTYNIRIGAIRWKIPDFLSDSNGNVCIFHRLLVKKPQETFDLEIFIIRDFKNVGQGHDTAFAVAPLDSKYSISCYGNSNVYSISGIFAHQEKCENFDIGN